MLCQQVVAEEAGFPYDDSQPPVWKVLKQRLISSSCCLSESPAHSELSMTSASEETNVLRTAGCGAGEMTPLVRCLPENQ